ncbi:MAG: nucleotidyltransferase [Cellulomonas sp.]|uniref:CBASS oligonucleotide cyclase n=1 Tax=Cellulomonas sp. 73-92 TaxID=1895740 RepID=UPI001AC8C36F|nr:CBASS oligonucleotide cyclase [Cellulomonas sp. 73-92]MBN9376213.1 nucleotidyltransferase [Cellulomonas sp.]
MAINDVLAGALASLNDRDVDATRQRLDEIVAALGDLLVDVDRLLFGGSVAKHTYVDGLSDTDALVVVNEGDATPEDLVARFERALQSRLPLGDVREITAGRLAVTVHYLDGSEIQLLPAVERNGRTSIASEDGGSWRQIRPHKFAEKLTEVNAANSGAVIPTIKLAKAVLANLPEDQRLSGYHVEAIAVDAFRAYQGRRDRASMLQHLIAHAEKAVMSPTGDITGQSVHVDDYLGASGSEARRAVSLAIRRIGRILDSGDASDYGRLLNG